MLNKLFIKNYKCFPTYEFSLAPLTLLTGANGAGKSSLIQAILLLKEVIDDGRSEITVAPQQVFGGNIGSAAQLVSQDFIDDREILLSADTGEGEISVRYKLERSNIQILKAYIEKCEFNQSDFPIIQYLRAERIGPRLNNNIGESEETLSSDGDNAAFLVDTADKNGWLVSDQLRYSDEPSKFSYQVEKYLSAIMGELTLNYKTDFDNALINTLIKTAAINDPVSEPLTGFGYSYALPIVVGGLLCSCKPGSVFVIENPEAHLHPSAQSKMGKFLALIASCGVQVIVETHSEHIVDGARIQSALQGQTDKMLIHLFSYSNKGTSVREIKVTKKGELSAWPKNFFDQKQIDLRELLGMKRS